MIVYLASPETQQQAEHCSGMPVLLSYAVCGMKKNWRWLNKGYQQSFSRILIDSGAFSELNTGAKVDLPAYADWANLWLEHADAVAGLDDIRGDWRRSLKNYEEFPPWFPDVSRHRPARIAGRFDCVGERKEQMDWVRIVAAARGERKVGTFGV